MDHPDCHIIFVNRNVGEERLVRAAAGFSPAAPADTHTALEWKDDQIRSDVQALLSVFGDVHVCASGPACISKLLQLQDQVTADMKPTLILLDIPHDQPVPEPQPSSRPPSPFSHPVSRDAEIRTPDENIYGLDLLQKVISEAHMQGISKLVVPIPIISFSDPDATEASRSMTDGALESSMNYRYSLAANRRLVRRCLDLGAVDVIISPLGSKCIASLEVCAYRAHRDASRDQEALMEIRKGRKRSWVGVNEQRPYAYLREAMVSSLMNGICRFSLDEDGVASAHLAVSSERQAIISEAVGKWHFCAISFSDDELLFAAMLMFKHTLAMPELESWRISTDHLISFLFACRSAYNHFVPYHNFRHVVDVLQATFSFLSEIGAVPPYPLGTASVAKERSPISSLLGPFETLTLLITAIGHDVGHPGVNNGFLTTLSAPLAQLYNDRSVLESFHCAAYSQILRRYWPAAFDDKNMRNLMISSILATDMGLHFDYMRRLGDIQEKLQHNNSTDGWNGRFKEEQRILACALLIKCADISNVARKHETALQWMYILSEEFSRQASMEEELEIKSSLFAPPKRDPVSLANAQLGFMNMFAIPLFQGVVDIIPALRYTVEELDVNKGLFQQMVQVEKAKLSEVNEAQRAKLFRDGTLSPRTMSFAVAPGTATDSLPEPRTEGGPGQGGIREVRGAMPSAILEVLRRDEKDISPPPSQPTKEFQSPHTMRDETQADGGLAGSNAIHDFAANDPFNGRSRGDSDGDSKVNSPGRLQRSSETTEGSTSGAGAGDWASQATSATTSKLPVSPSTRGTSIVSKESMDRPRSSRAAQGVPSPGAKGSPSTLRKKPSALGDEESASTGSLSKGDPKSLKKRPSRFRMRDFPFFKRSKAASPPYPSADTSG